MDLLHAHYDQFKHELSGIPHEVLMMDFWVPGSTTRQELDRFMGKEHFQKIPAAVCDKNLITE